eukprot:9167092-Pyramimonas_sp.AAC.1
MDEAIPLQYPLRLVGLLLESCVQSRIATACGCWSRPTRAMQAVLAGCKHASTLLTVLTCLAIVCVHSKDAD